MKRSLQYIFDRYPNVEKMMDGQNVPLTNVEDVYYQLALFIGDPETYSFNINLLYKFLENEDLSFALKIITVFFQKDTYLIKESGNILIGLEELNNTKMYNQTMFANYLSVNGLNFSPNKLSTYYGRKKLPKADLVINNTPYWFEQTVELYMKELLNQEQKK